MSAQDQCPEAILRRFFCLNSKHHPREYMHTPHSVSGRVVACNGHWLGVLDQSPTDLPPAPSAPEYYKPELALAAIDAYDGDFVPASSIGITTERCPHCRGTGHATEVDCDECGGQGYFQHGSHDYACKNCDGDGTLVHRGIGPICTRCHGVGRSPTIAPSTHGDAERMVAASGIYIAALRAMGGEISAQAVAFSELTPLIYILRFPGGHGALVPLRENLPLRLEDSDLAPPATTAEGSAA